MNLSITFVGAFANEESQYANDFKDVIEKSRCVNYLGALSHMDTFDIIGRSKVLLNVSFAEVLSLVELEAAVKGKWIVSSGTGYSNEYIQSNQLKIFPDHDLIKGLKLAYQLAISQPLSNNIADFPSWDEVGERYLAMYQDVILDRIKI